MAHHEIICPYFDECHLHRVGAAARNADLIREFYCGGEPRGCKTYLRQKADKEPEKTAQEER